MLFAERAGANGGGAPPAAATAGVVSPNGDDVVSLHLTAQTRYLNYALSVITSRALPDVRDGLKPVQRRILYTMWQQSVTFDAKHRKCAKIVGDVMGNYHPHGNEAIYDTLVRMAQPFSLRAPMVDGSGNFGSLDGDAPAAMRYTECRLARIADEMLGEIEQQTVDFRANYDGTRQEPVVLPARIPNLLINGATGIAVGMATNIPPHNLDEVCNALLRLLDALVEEKELSSRQLCRWIKGPDFPTGGQIISTAEEIKQIYETGAGSIKTRATWKRADDRRGLKVIHVTSIPYGVNKGQLVEQIGQIVLSRKLPLLVDVADLSTDDVCIALELKKDADEQMVMAYLFKHTALQSNFAVNMTALVPTENPEVGRPERCELKTLLWHFLHFRLEVVTNRLEYELAQLQRRIHILEGFEKVFDALDEIIRIIRRSDGKADAAQKIMARFELDAEQTDAILELKLYRLAKLEILLIRKELDEKRARVREIGRLLKDQDSRWKIVRSELEAVQKAYGKQFARKTIIEDAADEVEYSAEDFIIEEDCVVIVTRDGWVKRQKEVRDLSTQRMREGDSVLTAQAGSTRSTIVFFSNFGTAYTCRMIDVPATTGHGDPIQKLFKLKDGEKLVAAVSLDPRAIGEIKSNPKKPDKPPRQHAIAVTSDGYSLRFSLEPFAEVSTRAGRRFARPAKEAQVVGVEVISGEETIIAATRQGHAMLARASEVNYLTGPGRGVILIKVGREADRVLGFIAANSDRDTLTVETTQGAERRINTASYETTGRGGKGRTVIQRGELVRVIAEEPSLPVMVEN